MVVRQGSSAWLWKITARSRLGPSIACSSTMTTPSDGRSRPARMLSKVVLPQPEWPMTQTNSPRRIASHRSANTVVSPPGVAKLRAIPSIEMNLSPATAVNASFGERHRPRRAGERLIEHHADDADHQDGGDHVGDRQVVPFVPHEIADAGAAHEHLCGDEHKAANADGDAHAGEDGGRRRGQDHREGAPHRADL